MPRPSPLACLLAILWAQASLWPPQARARLPEIRALCAHHRLPCPQREQDELVPTSRVLKRLLEACPVLGAELADLGWLLVVLTVEVELGEFQSPLGDHQPRTTDGVGTNSGRAA